MELAGPKPQLKDMKLPSGQHMQPLALTPPTSPIVETELYAHWRTSLDSAGEDFLVWDSEQLDTESEGYSLYNDSDEICKYI
jgi:hypothetical protein